LASLSRRSRVVLLIILSVIVALIFIGRGMNARKIGGQGVAEPFRIAGNFYYVGATDASAFLITGPEGHIVIDAGYPTTAKLVMASIAKLGFNIRDVKVLLNSEPHPDHGGGLAVLQEASGAKLFASEPSAYTLSHGGDDPDIIFPVRLLVWLGLVGYPSARVDHVVRDGEVVRVGPLAVTAHITGGHTRGCTSWSFPVQDKGRVLNVVSACDIERLGNTRYAEQDADIQRSIRYLRTLPADIWVTSHARWWGRYRKFVASRAAQDPVQPFIDPDGYHAFLDSAEVRFRRGVVH
jgi:metallo-beta-lactamase class B